MPLPKLTEAQRAAALEKASAARRARAELKKELKDGKIKLSGVLKKSEKDEVAALLSSLPGIGAAKSKQIMESVGISESRRIGGLGPHQKKSLIERFG